MGARDLELLDAYSRTVTEVAERVGPSVAAVQVQDRHGKAAGSGSGFLFTADGYLLTNSHVVRAGGPRRPGGTSCHASFSDGRHFAARWVGDDPHTDLALRQVDGLSQGALVPAASARDFASGVSSACLMPAVSFCTTSGGVAAGAKIATQDSSSKPLRPASAVVGTFGRPGWRA